MCLDFHTTEIRSVWKYNISGVSNINPRNVKNIRPVQWKLPDKFVRNLSLQGAAIICRAAFCPLFFRASFLAPVRLAPFVRRRHLFKDAVLQNLPYKIYAAFVWLKLFASDPLSNRFSADALSSVPLFVPLLYHTFLVCQYLFKKFLKKF